jgi:glycosyl transferase, family 25
MKEDAVALGVLLVLLACMSVLLSARFAREHFSSSSPGASYRSYVINMPRNPERLTHFRALYAASDMAKVPCTVVAAVDGKKLEVSKYVSEKAFSEITQAEENGFRTMHYQLTRGAVGCYISHLKAWRSIAVQKEPYAIVFEDDVAFGTDVLMKTHAVLARLPPGWDLLLLGCICIRCTTTTADEDVRSVQQYWHMHGYVLTPDGAKRLLGMMDERPFEMQIDSELSRMASAGKVTVYCVTDNIASQNNGFKTTIQVGLVPNGPVNPFLLGRGDSVPP